MAAARISAGYALAGPVVPRFVPAAPEDFGLYDNLLVFDVEEIFRLAYRVGSFGLAWSVSGEVEDEDAGTRTTYSGSGTAICRRYFSRFIGEGLDYFTRSQGFFADFGQEELNTYADSVRKTLSALGSQNFPNLSLNFEKEGGVAVSVYDLNTGDLLDEYSQDAAFTLSTVQGVLNGFGGGFFVKFWPEVVISLVADGFEVSSQSFGPNTYQRSGLFLGRPFDFYTRPEITVSLAVTAGPEMPL